ANADLVRDLAVGVPTLAEVADLLHEVDRSVFPPGDVLDETHDAAVVLGRVDHDSGDLGDAEHSECLEAAFTANQVKSIATRRLPAAHRNRPLEAYGIYVVDDLTMLALVA